MVFSHSNYDPQETHVSLQVRLTTSPTLSLSQPDATLDVTLGIRIVDSKHPQEPITILIYRSVFEVFGDMGMDMFARGAFGYLAALDDKDQPTGKIISPGFFRVNEIMNDDSLNLRECGLKFLTIPGDGSEVTVTHKLTWERIFKYEEELTKDDLRPGERFRIGVNKRYMGTSWWCLGDLEGNLKDKKFHPWTTDFYGDQRPDDDFVREGNWVLGRDPDALHWKIDESERTAIFEIVE
ncbi:hypothetical protein DV738_g356, partial [Chaetothyriales sp. CBS 135597]